MAPVEGIGKGWVAQESLATAHPLGSHAGEHQPQGTGVGGYPGNLMGGKNMINKTL